MTPHLLIIVSQLLGSAQGPVVHTQVLRSASQCEIARNAVVETVDEATSTLAGANKSTDGVNGFGRRFVTTRCEPLSPARRSK